MAHRLGFVYSDKRLMTRLCKTCGVEKPLEAFTKHKHSVGGHLRRCKECVNRQRRESFRANPERRQRNNERVNAFQAQPEQRAKQNVRQRAYRLDPEYRALEAKRARETRKANPERVAEINRRSMYKRKYGITVEDYDHMVEAQGNKCAICRRTQPKGKRFHVDHIHGTNVIRGLLCTHCNTGIGLLADDPKVLRTAADYVEAHNLLQLPLTERSN